jgi:hypothetical protein
VSDDRPDGLTADSRPKATDPITVPETQSFSSRSANGVLGAQPEELTPRTQRGGVGSAVRAIGLARAYSRRDIRKEMPRMTAATTTPLQSKLGPIVADAAGTITIQEASDLLDCSRFRVGELLNASAGRVLVTDVLALTSLAPPSALRAPPVASSSAK